MKKSNPQVRLISGAETQFIRHKVLWPHRESVEVCTIDIDDNKDTIHLGAFIEDELVSIATFFKMKSDRLIDNKIYFEHAYRLRAMATLPQFEGKNAGRAILTFAMDHLREMNADAIWCNARAVALGFYEKLGFEMIDEWYEIPIIGPHKLMYISLKRN